MRDLSINQRNALVTTMDIMSFIFAILIQWNAMLAAGWTYDPFAMKWTPPSQATVVEPDKIDARGNNRRIID